MSPYAKRLQELLLRTEVPQGKLARAVGISQNHVSQVLSGAKSPFSQEIQDRICSVLNLSDADRKELEQLAAISKTTFRLRQGARPEEFAIVALFSGTSPFTAHTYIAAAKLAMAAYEASIPQFAISAQLESN
jgi:transcriptional regulator with XRE-family HTH domain